MKMDRRLTNGLAWAGALLVIGIPAADYLAGTFAGSETPRVAVVDAPAVPAAQPAAVAPIPVTRPASEPRAEAPKPTAETPKPQAVASSGDAVDGFLQSGKPLPSYITGGDTQPTPVATPARPVVQPTQPAAPQTAATPPVVTPPVATTPAPAEQVAALPTRVAPVPMPLSMRPRPVTVPLATDQPLIIDGAGTMPVAPVRPSEPDFVTSEDLDDWEAGPLNEFLARRGQQSSATYRVQQNQPAYDGNGFWLDEGPNSARPPSRYAPPVDDEVYYLPF